MKRKEKAMKVRQDTKARQVRGVKQFMKINLAPAAGLEPATKRLILHQKDPLCF